MRVRVAADIVDAERQSRLSPGRADEILGSGRLVAARIDRLEIVVAVDVRVLVSERPNATLVRLVSALIWVTTTIRSSLVLK